MPSRSSGWTRPHSLIIVPMPDAFGRVKLITLPVRERVEIQLDNPGATLVEEERIVPLVKGENQVDFSWANTQIDPNTIVFRVVGPERRGAARREGPLRQLSAQRSGARLDRRRERFGLGPRADQLPARQPHQELQLPGRRLERREVARTCRSTCGCRTSPTRSSAARACGPASASGS